MSQGNRMDWCQTCCEPPFVVEASADQSPMALHPQTRNPVLTSIPVLRIAFEQLCHGLRAGIRQFDHQTFGTDILDQGVDFLRFGIDLHRFPGGKDPAQHLVPFDDGLFAGSRLAQALRGSFFDGISDGFSQRR